MPPVIYVIMTIRITFKLQAGIDLEIAAMITHLNQRDNTYKLSLPTKEIPMRKVWIGQSSLDWLISLSVAFGQKLCYQ